MFASRILILGCGMIGSAVARDLSRLKLRTLTIADNNAERLSAVAGRFPVTTVQADLSQPDTIGALAKEHDIIVGALPGPIGYAALRAVVESGRHAVDISFMPEDALALDGLARANGATAVVDCGVAPGLSHMMAADSAAKMVAVEKVAIYVGGLPLERRPPWEYKAAFSPWDVIEEYVRPARVVQDGRVVLKNALSDLELIDIPGVGVVEAFLTDGLRTLPGTLKARTMTEKTLRYPGHCGMMRVLRNGGFFSKEPVSVGSQTIRPIDATAALIFPQWSYRDGEADLTILRVTVEGRTDEGGVRHAWDMLDRYDPATDMRSMSRTTAFPASIVVGLIEQGKFPPGIHPPEIVGQKGMLDLVLRELASRGVRCERRVERT